MQKHEQNQLEMVCIKMKYKAVSYKLLFVFFMTFLIEKKCIITYIT